MKSKKEPISVTHPHIAALWHPTRNGDLKPEDVTRGSQRVVCWICPVHESHEWKAEIKGSCRRKMSSKCPCSWPVINTSKKEYQQYVRDQYELGRSQRDLSNELDISEGTIRNWCIGLGRNSRTTFEPNEKRRDSHLSFHSDEGKTLDGKAVANFICEQPILHELSSKRVKNGKTKACKIHTHTLRHKSDDQLSLHGKVKRNVPLTDDERNARNLYDNGIKIKYKQSLYLTLEGQARRLLDGLNGRGTRKVKCSLTIEQVLILLQQSNGYCMQTGVAFVYGQPYHHRSPSMDRIDSAIKDHTLENCQVVTLEYQYRKNRFTEEAVDNTRSIEYVNLLLSTGLDRDTAQHKVLRYITATKNCGSHRPTNLPPPKPEFESVCEDLVGREFSDWLVIADGKLRKPLCRSRSTGITKSVDRYNLLSGKSTSPNPARSGRKILSDDQVEEIRNMYRTRFDGIYMSSRQLSKKFNVSKPTILRVIDK
jgi:hypothetical protein